METPKDELANLITERLHDPGKFVERGPGDRPSKQEPLKMWQTRAIMGLFADVQKREVDGKGVTVIARTEFRDPDPELDGE